MLISYASFQLVPASSNELALDSSLPSKDKTVFSPHEDDDMLQSNHLLVIPLA